MWIIMHNKKLNTTTWLLDEINFQWMDKPNKRWELTQKAQSCCFCASWLGGGGIASHSKLKNTWREEILGLTRFSHYSWQSTVYITFSSYVGHPPTQPHLPNFPTHILNFFTHSSLHMASFPSLSQPSLWEFPISFTFKTLLHSTETCSAILSDDNANSDACFILISNKTCPFLKENTDDTVASVHRTLKTQ